MINRPDCDTDGFGPNDVLAYGLEDVSRETIDRLIAFRQLLSQWNETHNLVGRSELNRFWRRHVLDSLQVFCVKPNANSWVDFGSGAGFPGIVVASCLAATGGGQCTLIESNTKKAAFLRTVSANLSLPVTVMVRRIEAVSPFEVDVITARALADLDTLLSYAEQWMALGAECIFLKGKDVENERDRASRRWQINDTLTASVSDSEGILVHITEASRVE